MITNFKIFEKNNEPKIGDYVICYIDFSGIKSLPDAIYDIEGFVNTNIGEIIGITDDSKNNYKIFYNLPDEMILAIHSSVPPTDRERTFYFNKDNILFCSNKKEECELFLKSKKYNL